MKKIFILCLALVLALGSLGAAYALWYDDLYIVGTIETGEVCAYWDFCGCFDIEDKDVGDISCQIDPTDNRILHVSVTNGYPCYFGDCEVEFTICGTVPVILEDIIITAQDFTLASANGANDGELWVDLVDGLHEQYHPGDGNAQSFKVHVEQCAEQGAVYHFTIKQHFVQYNESAYGP